MNVNQHMLFYCGHYIDMEEMLMRQQVPNYINRIIDSAQKCFGVGK